MIPKWFMSIRNDIYGFVCMGFVLVELFDEWVYGLCYWWLSKVYCGKFRGFEL